jgi:glycosyltransferase involved in cell wall biosynthesis
MRNTQFLIFEIGTGCQLAKEHQGKCPIDQIRREGRPLKDEEIISAARIAYERHGFRGFIGWHYYNEPTLLIDRVLGLMEQIRKVVPQSRFVLWTNGISRPTDPRVSLFEQVWVTDYRGDAAQVRQHYEKLGVIQTFTVDNDLDNRIAETKSNPIKTGNRCLRPFTELIFDNCGGAHLCCYDWRREVNLGNLRDGLSIVLGKRQIVMGNVCCQPMKNEAPTRCLQCQTRTELTRFDEDIAQGGVEWVNALVPNSSKPTLSVCLLTKDVSGFLPTCLGSVLPHVDEVVVVDTGSTDDTVEKARALGAKVFVHDHKSDPDCFMYDGATGSHFMADEAKLRNFAFEHASGDFKMWIDSDDTVENAAQLPRVIADMQLQGMVATWLRYDYFHFGDLVTCEYPRERIIKSGIGTFVGETHTIHIRPSGLPEWSCPDVWINHHRDLPDFQNSRPPVRIERRAYRILLAKVQRGEADARTLYYLANESVGEEALSWYEKYLRVSTWEEERASARLRIGTMHELQGDYERAFRYFSAALIDAPIVPDGWFYTARIAHHRGWWQMCCDLTEAGLARPVDAGRMPHNPLDRTWRPHLYYNYALAKLGRYEEALASCNAGLKIADSAQLRANKLACERKLKART